MPAIGRTVPAASCALANAIAKSLSMPITSPVDFISGPRTGSVPGKRAKGNTASLTAICFHAGRLRSKLARLSPAITRAAILASGMPVALAVNGTVRLARGLTSIR